MHPSTAMFPALTSAVAADTDFNRPLQESNDVNSYGRSMTNVTSQAFTDANDQRENSVEKQTDPKQSLATKMKCKQESETGIKPPGLSYIALISMAIQSSSNQKMLLSEIYQWISERYSYYQLKDKSWRNSIRHNLSLNECFVKSGRSENGKGNYWSIHPANMADFATGDYRRRRARRRVRKCDEDLQRLCTNTQQRQSSPQPPPPETYDGYVPMVSKVVPASYLTSLGVESIKSHDEWLSNQYPSYQSRSHDYKFAEQSTDQKHEYEYYQNYLRNRVGNTAGVQYFGHPVQQGTSLATLLPNESTFNVNVNVNVCGNPNTSPPQYQQTAYPSACASVCPQSCVSGSWQEPTTCSHGSNEFKTDKGQKDSC